ncbi:MAG: STAS domain-containing protein [Terracidiphilus sp.]
MNSKFANPQETVLLTPCGPHELVRGQEQCLIERVAPVLQRNNVTLDLHNIERIDAAGIAALISLYRKALDADHEFTIIRAVPRVASILTLVGLDGILLSHDAVSPAVDDAQAASRFRRSAAA